MSERVSPGKGIEPLRHKERVTDTYHIHLSRAAYERLTAFQARQKAIRGRKPSVSLAISRIIEGAVEL